MAATKEQLATLREDTPPGEVKTRTGPGGMKLSYVDARFVYDQLDDKVGPANWADQFVRDAKGLRAGIGINCMTYDHEGQPNGSEWVWKWDTGTPSSMEPEKGEYSDSLKRAGVHWGIARDLYDPSSDARTGVGHMTPAAAGAAAHVAAARASGAAPAAPKVAATGYASSGWSCPVHGSVKVIPAGVSKRTMKSYPAFEVCPTDGCDEKPPRGSKKPAPMYTAPQPSEFIGMTPEDDDDGSPFGDGTDFESIEA